MTETTSTPTEVEVPQDEEVNPLELIEMLSNDLATALDALRHIVRLDPRQKAGGPHNKKFGKRFQQCFEEAQQAALNAVLAIKENQ